MLKDVAFAAGQARADEEAEALALLLELIVVLSVVDDVTAGVGLLEVEADAMLLVVLEVDEAGLLVDVLSVVGVGVSELALLVEVLEVEEDTTAELDLLEETEVELDLLEETDVELVLLVGAEVVVVAAWTAATRLAAASQ